MNKRLVFKTAGVVLLLAVWQISSSIIGMEMLFASPFQVIKKLPEIVCSSDFPIILGSSSLRIVSGFLLAFAAGIILAAISGTFKYFDDILWSFIAIIKSVPVASFIVLLIIWFDNGITPAITFLIAFPIIYGNVLQGIKSIDPSLKEVAGVYRMSRFKRIVYIVVPGISGHLMSASSTAMGMAWKAGVAAELIGMVTQSIGEKLYDSKVNFLNAELLAWTVIIVLSSVIFEKLFALLLKFFMRRLYRI